MDNWSEKDKKDQTEGFKCLNCGTPVSVDDSMGTKNRNHCPSCLYSIHVDKDKSGDRKSSCQALMKPIGLTFKQEGLDKYGKEKQGELMIIHECLHDKKISINRIAADDNPETILKIFSDSQNLNQETLEKLESFSILLLTENDKEELKTQLLGKS